jgi:hypothetical protein
MRGGLYKLMRRLAWVGGNTLDFCSENRTAFRSTTVGSG